MSKIQFPVVHLNGSGKANLREQFDTAVSLLEQASSALRLARPHARDYYPDGDAAYYVANDQHQARINAVENILDEMVQIRNHIRFNS